MAGELGRLDGIPVMVSDRSTDKPGQRQPRGPWARRSNRGPRRRDGRAWCRIPELLPTDTFQVVKLPPHAPGSWRVPVPVEITPWASRYPPWYLTAPDGLHVIPGPRFLTSWPPAL